MDKDEVSSLKILDLFHKNLAHLAQKAQQLYIYIYSYVVVRESCTHLYNDNRMDSIPQPLGAFRLFDL